MNYHRIFPTLIIVLFIFIYVSPTTDAQNYNDHRTAYRLTDSLENVLMTSPPEGADLLRIYKQLANSYIESNHDKAVKYTRKAIDLSILLGYPMSESDMCKRMGNIFDGEGIHDSALYYYNLALDATGRMAKDERYDISQVEDNYSMIYGSIGNCYNYQNKCQLAIEYYNKALQLFEKYNWMESQVIAYSNIGQMYQAMMNDSEAEFYYKKGMEVAEKTGDSLMIATFYKGFCVIYLNQKRYDEALSLAQANYRYYYNHRYEGENVAEPLSLLAEVYLEGFGDLENGEKYAKLSIEECDRIGFDREKGVSYRILSTIYLKREQWKKSEQFALKALEIDTTEVSNISGIYENLVIAYSYLGKPKLAEQYLAKLVNVVSNYSNHLFQSTISEMEVMYETQKKEMRIQDLEKEQKVMRWFTTSTIIILVLALAAIIFLWRLIVQNKKMNHQKKEIADQEIIRLEQEKQIIASQAVIDGETAERTRIAKDLHDGLGSMLTGIILSMESLRSKTLSENSYQDSLNKTITKISESMTELRRITHHLMPDSLQRFGLKSALSDFCSSFSIISFSYFGDETRLDSHLEVTIYRIVHELVNNALKHSKATKIVVQVMQEKDFIALIVSDNGCGFSPKKVKKGMGLHNITDRVNSYNGRINIDSSPERGTEINIEFKL